MDMVACPLGQGNGKPQKTLKVKVFQVFYGSVITKDCPSENCFSSPE